MRLSLAIHLLLLAMLLSQAQGFRLGKRLLSVGLPKFSVGHPKLHEAAQMKKINDGMGDVVYCKKERCTGKKNEEDKVYPNSKAKSGNEPFGEKQERPITVNSSAAISGHRNVHEQYEEIMDIAEKDYSPARRKPPIHNK